MFYQPTLDPTAILMDRHIDITSADGGSADLNLWVSPGDTEDTVIEITAPGEYILVSLDFTALHKLYLACQDALGIQSRLAE